MNKDKNNILIWPILIIGPAVVILSVFCFNYVLSKVTGLDYPDNSGSFGDQFGVLNTTFAGLAFIGVICALLQQQNQINQQAADLKEQNRRIDLQQFERFFYKQVKFIDNLSKKIHYGNFIGNQALSNIADSIKFCLEAVRNPYSTYMAVSAMDNREEYNEKWNIFDTSYSDMLPWSNKIYSLILYIKTIDFLRDREKYFYINIIFEILPANQKYILQIMGCISDDEQYRKLERSLENENFFPVASNLIFDEDKNISIFKQGLGFGKKWFSQHIEAIAKGEQEKL